MPALIPPELGEREPTRHLHAVLVLLGEPGAGAKNTDESRHGRNGPHASARHSSCPFPRRGGVISWLHYTVIPWLRQNRGEVVAEVLMHPLPHRGAGGGNALDGVVSL